MRSPALTILSATMALAFCIGAGAANLSKEEYKAGKTSIAAQLKSAKAACAAFKSNAKDICMQEAKGADKVALAELETRYEPSTKHRYDLAAAQADAVYAVAKEKCDDLAGNTKDVCRKEAKSVHVKALAEARLSEKTVLNNAEAADSNASAQKTATTAISKADYQAAAEKCETMTGLPKTQCISDAKAKFGQN